MLDFARSAPLVYGPWKTWKGLFKQVETAFIEGNLRDAELLGAFLGRLDAAPFPEKTYSQSPALPGLNIAPLAIIARENLVYVLESSGALHVLDWSEPALPKIVGGWKPAKTQTLYDAELFFEGAQLLVVSDNALRIFDLENPLTPAPIGSKISFSGDHFEFANGHLFVAGSEGIRAFALPKAGEKNLTRVGEFATDYVYRLYEAGQKLFVLGYENGGYRFRVLDVSDPTNLRGLGVLNVQNPTGVIVQNQTAFVADNDNLRVFDLSSDKPREIAKIKIAGAQMLHLDGSRLYITTSEWDRSTYTHKEELKIVDVSQPFAPRQIGVAPRPLAQNFCTVQDHVVLIARDGFRVLDASDPTKMQPVGQNPSAKTFAYLKRRARRLLRVLSEAETGDFVPLAAATLAESGAGRDAIDLAQNWVSADLLFSNSGRFEQKRHGRGAYQKIEEKFVRWTREERAPQKWDANLEAAQKLWRHPHLPAATQEMVFKILRANQAEIAPPTPAQLARLASGTSPAMVAWAVRQIEKSLLENPIAQTEPRAAAAALFALAPRRRNAILARFDAAEPTWRAETATHLANLIGRNTSPEAASLTRRARSAALLLAARFDLSDASFSANGLLAALPLLLAAGEAPLREIGLNACRRLSADQALKTLELLENAPANVRENAIEALCESAATGSFDQQTIDEAIRAQADWQRAAAWRLIAVSQTENETFRAVWTRLFLGLRSVWLQTTAGYRPIWSVSDALQTAVNSNSALDILARCEVDWREIVPKLWQNRNLGEVAPEVFAAYCLILPAEHVVEAFSFIPNNERWPALRGAWLHAFANRGEKLAAFWQAVQAFLADEKHDETAKSLLRARVFQDADIAATFGGASGDLKPDLLLSLIAAVPDAVWASWRASFLEKLRANSAQRAAFWNAVRTGEIAENLRVRLFEDAEIAATFGLLEDDVLDADNPAFEPLLLAWLNARQNELSETVLLQAATHPLNRVRDWGLAQLQARGLNLPVALKLMESGLPPAIVVGRNWFQNEPIGGPREVEKALALCDSPNAEVRQIGRDFVAARLDSLLENGILEFLQETPNAEMQSFVAQKLLEKPSQAAKEFDETVLRSRRQARRAKSLVQQRHSEKPLENAEVLLELARGRTPRDAEWAWMQLAKRAANGENLAEIEVSGVAAI